MCGWWGRRKKEVYSNRKTEEGNFRNSIEEKETGMGRIGAAGEEHEDECPGKPPSFKEEELSKSPPFNTLPVCFCAGDMQRS